MAELSRALVTLLGGLALGLTMAEGRFYWRRWRTGEANPRLLPLVCVRLGIAALVVFAELALIERLGREYLTWRVPLAFAAFVLLGAGLLRLLVLDEDARR